MTPEELSDILWAFEHFYHLDKSNAPIHCAPVRFSPITFRLARIVFDHWPDGELMLAHINEVRHAEGAYELDTGR